MRAAAYVRVSSDEQVDTMSLPAQRRQIAAYCEQKGHQLVAEFADEGVSAYTDQISKRPALQRLLEAAERREFDVVIVHTLDRWARKLRVQMDALERLGRADVGFASVTEQIDYTTPSGRLMLTMMGAFSEFFSDQLGMHIKKSMRERFETGRHHARPPYGYTSQDGMLVLDPEAAPIVLEMFLRRMRGDSYAEIARWMNGIGALSTWGSARTSATVLALMGNPVYAGLIRSRGELRQGAHEGIVPRELFEAVQRRRQAPHRRPPGGPHGALMGHIRCVRCRGPLWNDRRSWQNILYREKRGSDCVTDGKSVSAATIDRQMGEIFGAMRLDEDLLARALLSLRREQKKAPNMEALRERRRRLSVAFADGAFSMEEYQRRRTAIDDEMQEATPKDITGLTRAADLLRDLPRLWELAHYEERAKLVSALVETVDVDMASQRITGFVAHPEFDALLHDAMRETEFAPCAVKSGLMMIGGS